ncbi:MAG: cation diffusion facilitator family transporter [Candidatus Aminicenantia bacterium]
MEDSKLEQKGERITWAGFFVNFFLFFLKLLGGILGRSSAILADSFHTLTDISTDIIVLLGLKISTKKEDEDHPYGHGKAETISAFTLGIFLFLAGLAIFVASTQKLISILRGFQPPSPTILALSMGILSIICKETLYRYTIYIGRKIGSSAIIANAWHHRSDALSSIASSSGVGGAIILGKKWIVLDPIAGALVAILIVKVGYEILSKEIRQLMEASPEMEIRNSIEKILKENPYVREFHRLRMRYIGRKIAVDFHLVLDEDISFSKAHSIATLIEDEIKREVSKIHTIVIHMETARQEPVFENIEEDAKKVIDDFKKIKSFHRFQIFPLQNSVKLALDIVLPGDLTLEKGHEIARELRENLLKIKNVKDVIIHIDIEGKEEE